MRSFVYTVLQFQNIWIHQIRKESKLYKILLKSLFFFCFSSSSSFSFSYKPLSDKSTLPTSTTPVERWYFLRSHSRLDSVPLPSRLSTFLLGRLQPVNDLVSLRVWTGGGRPEGETVLFKQIATSLHSTTKDYEPNFCDNDYVLCPSLDFVTPSGYRSSSRLFL